LYRKGYKVPDTHQCGECGAIGTAPTHARWCSGYVTRCWADKLLPGERCIVAAMLARSCKLSYDIATRPASRRQAVTLADVFRLKCISAESSDLHLDVTERAA
jgi:hypothetical protein